MKDGSVHTASHPPIGFTTLILPKMLSLTHLASNAARAALPHARFSEIPSARLATGVTRLPAPGAPIALRRHAQAPSQMNRMICKSHAVFAGAPKVEGEVGVIE